MNRRSVNGSAAALLGVLVVHMAASGETDAYTEFVDLIFYAVDQKTDELLRYRFETDTLNRIGTVKDQNDVVVHDVDALARVAGGSSKGLYGAANFDGGKTAHLLRFNVFNASVLSTDTGLAEISCMTAFRGEGANPIDAFSIASKNVVPAENFAVRVSVLGCAYSYGGYYDIPVTLDVEINDVSDEPFGETMAALAGGNLNDGVPRQWVAPGTFDAGATIKLTARGYLKYSVDSPGTSESEYYLDRTVSSDSMDEYLLVLRDGDPVPNYVGFLDQDDLADFVQPYVDPATNTMRLDANEAIFCFELAGAPMNNPATDFQDIVVLVSLADDPSYFFGGGEWVLLATARPDAASTDEKLVLIDPGTCAVAPMLTLHNGPYRGRAAGNDNTLYAVRDNELWHIDLSTGAETPIGTQTLAGHLSALEVGLGDFGQRIHSAPLVPDSWGQNGVLFGFDPAENSVVVLDTGTGNAKRIPCSFEEIDADAIVVFTKSTDSWGDVVSDAHD